MKCMKKQRGLSTMEILFGLFILGVAVAVILKFTPVYIEYFDVRTSLQALQSDMANNDAGNAKTLLMTKLQINDVKHVGYDQIKVERRGRNKVVSVEYEVRTPLFANIDVVIHFADSVELK